MEEKQKLTLSEEESKSHLSIYKKIKQNMASILETQDKCVEFLVKRGQLSEDQATQIYQICIKHSQSKKKLDQQSFSCILKYLSAIQQGKEIDDIEDIFELSELKPPSLSKRSSVLQKDAGKPVKRKSSNDSKQEKNEEEIEEEENQQNNSNNNNKKNKEKDNEEENNNNEEEEKEQQQQKQERKQSDEEYQKQKKQEELQTRHHRSETFGVQQDSPIKKQSNQEKKDESDSNSQDQEEPCFGMSNKKQKKSKKNKKKKNSNDSQEQNKKEDKNEEKEKDEKLETIDEQKKSQENQKSDEELIKEFEENKNKEKQKFNNQPSQDSLGINDSNISESGFGLLNSKIQNANANQLEQALQQLNQNYENNQLYMKYDEIKVINYQEKKDSYFSKTYITYTIKTRIKNKNHDYFVSKRFNDFVDLDTYFHNKEQYQNSIIPKLPDKNIGNQITSLLGYDNQNFLEQRKIELEIYLKNIVEDELLSNDSVLEGFLTDSSFQIPNNNNSWYISNTLSDVIDKISNSKFQDLKDEYQSYIKTYWDSYTQNQDEGDSELQDIKIQLEKLDNYEKFLVGVRNFVQSQMKCQQQQIQVIQGLTNLMPQQQDSKNVQELKHEIQESQEKYFKDDKMMDSRKQLEYFIKKQLSCIYGLKQKYNELLSMIFEVQYYQELLNQKISNGNESDKPKLQKKLIKQQEHKNNIKTIYLQALKKFIGNMGANLQKTLACVKETELQQWSKFKQ